MTRIYQFLALTIILSILFIVHLFCGSTSISASDFIDSFIDYDNMNTNHLIARDLRFTRAVMALLAGSALSLSGLLMQTLFNNPLAEPNILGVSTGASLFVALTMVLGFQFLYTDWGIVSSALLGAFLFGIIILFFARYVRHHVSLLLLGIMLGSFAASILSMMHVWGEAQRLKSFSLWTMGSLQYTTFEQLPLVLLLFLIGVVACFFLVRSLNAMLLGETNASYLGINSLYVRIGVVFVASMLTGIITAFCGPIAFVGMAVPNMVKMIVKTSDHLILLCASILLGGAFLLLCDSIVQLLSSYMIVPINVFTAMLGAPFVVLIILKHWS